MLPLNKVELCSQQFLLTTFIHQQVLELVRLMLRKEAMVALRLPDITLPLFFQQLPFNDHQLFLQLLVFMLKLFRLSQKDRLVEGNNFNLRGVGGRMHALAGKAFL